MTTLRVLGAMVAATLLAAPAVGVAPRTADDSQTRTVNRAYGDGPVRLGATDVLRIRVSSAVTASGWLAPAVARCRCGGRKA